MNDAAEVVVGSTSAPERGLYSAMTTVWLRIDTSLVEPIPGNKRSYANFVEFSVGYLENTRDRGDYKELMALSLVLLDAYPAAHGRYHIRSVGSICNARWMAILLCEMKLVLFRSQFVSLGIVSVAAMKLHTQLVQFLIRCYVQPWLMCPDATAAAPNDLELFRSLTGIPARSPLKKFAKPMLAKLKMHTWYLSQEWVVMCMFGSHTTEDEKARCALAMLEHRKAGDLSATPAGKLVQPSITSNTKIWELFGSKSWLLWHLNGMGIENPSFLTLPVRLWPEHRDYQRLQMVVNNMKVVNDPAERGILLARILQNKVTFDPTERQKLVISVPHLRQKLKILKKSDLIHCELLESID